MQYFGHRTARVVGDANMDFKPISTHWNRVDTLIYKMECLVKHLIGQWKESKEPEPNIEDIISAEVEHLTAENEEYKKMLYPMGLIVREGKKHCPGCDKEIPDDYTGKCCFECGQRIKRNSTSD